MKWLLIAAGVIVVLAVVVFGVGYALPVAHVASRSINLRTAPPEVWATITDVAAYPSWRSDVDSVEILAPVENRQAWREMGSNGTIAYVMTQVDAPTRMVTRIADPDLPFGGEWEYAITPRGVGSRVVITERGEVYDPFFRFVSRFVMGHTSTLDAYLGALGRRLGESTEPGHAPTAGSGNAPPNGSDTTAR